jgi:uncharacterized protein (DUF4415 family)
MEYGSNGVMAKAKVRAVLVDGKPYQKKADGSLVPLKGKTDWKLLDRQTSAQTEAIAAHDREGAPMSDAEWARAEIVRPEKVAVGIKLDSDVLGWFKDQGKGYQTRINTVLRRFYEVNQKSGALDNRHRDQNGEIHQRRGDPLVGTLRSNYGKDFAQGVRSDMRLDTPRHKKGGSRTKAVKRK